MSSSMRSTTLSGEVSDLQRVNVAGENSFIFKIKGQSVRLYARQPVLKNGDQIVVAGKYRGDVFVSTAIHNLTQSETTGQKWVSKFIPYLFAALFLGLGVFVTFQHLHHGHGPHFKIICGALFFVGFGCLYFPLSQFWRRYLLRKTVRNITKNKAMLKS